MNPIPDELVRALATKRLWRPLNTYGLLFIASAVGVAIGYTIAIL